MNQKGFTLIEMMVVLLVISILILITIPNLTKQQGVIRSKGCEAYINMVQAQIEAYKMEFNTSSNPTISELKTSGYIPETECPNGEALQIASNGEVNVVPEP
ncbi:competence type IV pilus major pilin ComGC [Bacillus pinisoli]|uniref:competence type IV pilus major pilin ComGC n=1 Tax=Bacillus pinisoli TaxID=2901866 RepID=UPI001FF5F906|nr:competence type IV pilus major pilin ComGC [Bacillus pinisoli]